MTLDSFPAREYLRAKSVWRGKPQYRRNVRGIQKGTQPFGSGRDPNTLGNVLQTVVQDMGWSGDLEQARILEEWGSFAGAAIAEHTRVLGISQGILQVQCDSTTWATELRRLRAEMLTRLLREYPAAEVRDMRFLAPGAPTWRHGARVIPGRGPRDTYG